MNIHEIEYFLQNFDENFASDNASDVKLELARLKQKFVNTNNQSSAKDIWCLETIFSIQNLYILIFNLLESSKYYNAWLYLEDIEKSISLLSLHFDDQADTFHIQFIKKCTKQYQSLFPYKLFTSPEFLVEQKICSICKQPILIRNRCGHKIDNIYNGEVCYYILSGIKFIAVALVENPVQKFCVLFSTDSQTGESIDHYDYSLLQYLMKYLQSPFHDWSMEWIKIRHPHSRFRHIKNKDLCPCESGKKYKECCLYESGVLRLHCQFSSSVPPPNNIKKIQYIGYKKPSRGFQKSKTHPNKFSNLLLKCSDFQV